MTQWVLAREVRRLPNGDRLYEFFGGRNRHTGRMIVTPLRREAERFSTAVAANECAETHPEMRNSDRWRALEVVDGNRVRPRRGTR